MKQVEVQYFAVFREKAGMSGETVQTAADTYEALYNELQAKHNFPLTGNLVRVAVDDTYVNMSDEIQEGKETVFIPPVAGG